MSTRQTTKYAKVRISGEGSPLIEPTDDAAIRNLVVLTRLNPLTYSVDPMRRAVFDHVDVSPQVRAALAPGLSWGGWRVPVALELGIVAVTGAALLCVAIAEFRRID